VSPNTILAYCGAVERLADYLVASELPSDVVAIRRDHLEAFIADALDRFRPATANHRFRGVQRFFNYLVNEGVLASSPLARMRPPRIPEDPPAVLTRAEQVRLLAACEGSGFEACRDKAIVSVFLDTGARRAEVAGLRWTPDDDLTNDFDLDGRAIRVVGRGRRERLVRIGHKTVKDLDRYLAVRARHSQAHLASLWLGRRGGLTDSGIGQMVQERGRGAGLGDNFHPHQLRRTFAHEWLSSGGNEGDLRACRLAIAGNAAAICGVDRPRAGPGGA
jgi:site-specific recombinase XerC